MTLNFTFLIWSVLMWKSAETQYTDSTLREKKANRIWAFLNNCMALCEKIDFSKFENFYFKGFLRKMQKKAKKVKKSKKQKKNTKKLKNPKT